MADAEQAEIEVEEDEVKVEVAKPAGPPGMLRDRYSIRSGQPLSDLSTPSAEAFGAEDKRDPSRALFGLICKPELPPRVTVMRALKGVSSPGLLQLVEWGPMNWPPAGRQCMAVVYERPAGRRIMTNLKGEIRRVDEYEISKKVIEPLTAALKEITSRGVTHRAIRPTNIFDISGNGDRYAVGDCVTAPAGFDQPMLFETIESGMCTPIARGSGTFADDFYSFGVTLAFALLGRNPVAGLSDDAVLSAKIQQGSYNTLIGEERLPLAMIELLRGLLCDDGDQRWGLEDLDMWMSGRRMSPLQPRGEKRAARGFPFLGKEYFNGRELSQAMSKNWDAAIPPVVEGKVELWLRRAVEDKDKANVVAEVVRMALSDSADKKGATDLMLCKVLILLDHSAPIRYKGFNSMPDGFGAALAAVMASRGDTRLLTEIISREVPKLWFGMRGEYQPDNSLMEANFRELRGYLLQTGMGFGLERCLYEMNDALPCQSSLVGEEYVVEVKELLPALNVAAGKRSDSKHGPMDRHIAAFLGARMRSDIDRNLSQLNDQSQGVAMMATLNLYAVLQYRLGPESLPSLAGWMGAVLAPVVASYHGREKRKELEKEIPRLVRKGSIVEIYNLLENGEEKVRDEHEFHWAQAQYHAAEEEIKHIITETEERATEADRIGRQTAAVTGIIIAMVTATIVVISTVF
ncbi:MAG: serine/threonine-protein kinase [Phaeospirillum sp.]|nr:serine/threonine-protein kinase [Phaeospirillum sp.]